MKKLLTVIIGIFFFVFFLGQVMAQGNKALRIEINSRIDVDVFKLVPCGDAGVLVFYESVQAFDEMHTSWVFTLFDVNLRQVWSKDIPILKDAVYREFIVATENSYLVFYNEDRIKKGAMNAQFLKFDFASGDFISIYEALPEKAQIVEFEIQENLLYLGLNLKKSQIAVFVADFSNSKVKAFSYDNNGKNFLEDIFIDPKSSEVSVVVKHFTSRKENTIVVGRLGPEGFSNDSVAVHSPQPNIQLNSGYIKSLNGNSIILLGTYNTSNSQENAKDEEEVVSAGLYSVLIENGKAGPVNIYNFIDFQNFSSYLQTPAIMQMKRKAKKKENKEFSLNYRLLLHDVLMVDTQVVFVAEVYYPEYRTVSYMTYDYYGRPYPQSYTVFDGYKYFGGLAVGFDLKAEKIWDNGIKIWNLQSFVLNKKIISFKDGNELILAYNSSGKIASEIYRNGQVAGDFEYIDLKTKYPKDKILKDASSNMSPWYDNYFLCYGYQEIKNNALRNSEKRTVFYINKIAFD
jgi:hypothetical protein